MQKVRRAFKAKKSSWDSGGSAIEDAALASRLQLFPVELLLHVASYLKPVDYLCFCRTSQYFQAKLRKNRPVILNACQRWLLTYRWERDILFTTNNDHEAAVVRSPTFGRKLTKLACAFCKHDHPVADFTGHSLRNVLRSFRTEPNFIGDPHSLKRIPEARVCGFHSPETGWIPRPCSCHAPNARGMNKFWLRWMVLTCMCCGDVIKECCDERETGCLECECDTCPRLRMPMYERYGEGRKKIGIGGDNDYDEEVGRAPTIRGFVRRGKKLYILEVGGE